MQAIASAPALTLQSPQERKRARAEYLHRVDRHVNWSMTRLLTLSRQIERQRGKKQAIDPAKWNEYIQLQIEITQAARIGRADLGLAGVERHRQPTAS